MNFALLNAIKEDLGITSFDGESLALFTERVLYSASGQWIRHFVLDQDETWRPYPKTKKYILNRGKETISKMIDAFPEYRGWFLTEGEDYPYKEFIRETRDTMISIGELMKNNEGKIILPAYSRIPIVKDADRVVGLSDVRAKQEKYIGLTRIVDVSDRIEAPYLLHVNSIEFTNRAFAEGRYSICGDMERFECFNPKSKKALYQSWDSNPPDNRRFFGRIQIINGMNEYYLFRKVNDRWENARILDWYSQKGEYRRIMLGLRAENENPMSASYKDHGKAVMLWLYCRLPWINEMQLKMFCWPVSAHDDSFCFVVPKEIWIAIKEMLGDLCIELKEK